MEKARAIDIQTMIAGLEAVPMRRAAIARETGLSRTFITQIANGDRGRVRPSYDTVQRVRALYDRKVMPKM